jgi:hypothetical protein
MAKTQQQELIEKTTIQSRGKILTPTPRVEMNIGLKMYFLCNLARWSFLVSNAKLPNIGNGAIEK